MNEWQASKYNFWKYFGIIICTLLIAFMLLKYLSICVDIFDIHIKYPWKILGVGRESKGENCKKYLGYVVIIITFSHRGIKTSEKIDLFPIIQGITNWAENALAKAVLTQSWSNFLLVLFYLTFPKPIFKLKGGNHSF